MNMHLNKKGFRKNWQYESGFKRDEMNRPIWTYIDAMISLPINSICQCTCYPDFEEWITRFLPMYRTFILFR